MRKLTTRALIAALLCCGAAAGSLWADNWPAWRGPEQNGISKETKLPTKWSAKDNIAWKLDLPGIGSSTPIIWGDKIFLTSAENKSDLVLMCISTEGKVIWKKAISSGSKMFRSDEGNSASPTPCTDGKHVFAYVGTGDFACFDFDGNKIWSFNAQERYGKFSIQHGMHTTPVMHGDILYLALLHGNGHWVIAIDKATGKEVWKTARKTDAVGESKEAYTTPILWKEGGETVLVVHGCDYATAHSLKDGSEIWRLGDLNPKKNYSTAFRIIASPVALDDFLLIPTARGTLMVAVKPGAKGTIETGGQFEYWRKAKGAPDVPTGLVHDGLLYLCSEGGILSCMEAKTGKELYKERLHVSRYRASPVYGDGKIYLVGRDGNISVVKAGPKFELLATNVLPDEFTASPAISGGRLYLRGFKTLYAIQADVK